MLFWLVVNIEEVFYQLTSIPTPSNYNYWKKSISRNQTDLRNLLSVSANAITQRFNGCSVAKTASIGALIRFIKQFITPLPELDLLIGGLVNDLCVETSMKVENRDVRCSSGVVVEPYLCQSKHLSSNGVPRNLGSEEFTKDLILLINPHSQT